MRLTLAVQGALVLAAGFQLLVLSEQTERFFAWTVEPPLTAAVLGAFYWTSLGLLVASLRERAWAHVRAAVPGVFAFTTLTLVTTLVHLDRFHLDSDDPITLFATWAWIVVYAVVPPALLAMLTVQARAPGIDPPRRAPVPAWFRGVIGAQGWFAVGVGAVMWIAPTTVADGWPWTLTELTARALASWLVGMGLVLAVGAVEADWERLRASLVSALLLGLLQAAALGRFADQVAWGRPAAWLYASWMISVTAIGAYGWAAVRRAGLTPPGPPRVR
jgi:hypothetical protein